MTLLVASASSFCFLLCSTAAASSPSCRCRTAFVVAAAQVGEHEDGRRTYGHSLVVDPWGEVLLDMGGEEAGLGFVDIDLKRVAEVRKQVPSLANRRHITA